MAGLPAAAISATVLAPERHKTRSARAEKRRHVVDELVHLGGNRNSSVSGLHFIIFTLSGLMNHVQSGQTPHQLWQRADHRLIDGARSLAPAEYQQCRRSRRIGLPGNFKKRRAHRNSGNDCIAEMLSRLFEMHGRCRDKTRDHSIRESGNQVRLKRQGRRVLQDGRQHRRPGSVAADSDHDIGLKLIQHAGCGKNRARKIESGANARRQADPVQRANFHQLKGKSCGGNQPVLEAARGPDEHHFGLIATLQFLGDGESGDYVAASASARENGSHASKLYPSRVHSACLVMLSRTPMQASVINSDEPP